LAIGKESVPIRIAELTAGAHAILYASEKAVDTTNPMFLGLPSECQHKIVGDTCCLYSLKTAEHDIKGYARDNQMVLEHVNIMEMLNPCARGFRTLKITSKRKF